MPTAPENREKRRQIILEIIARQPIARQSEFVTLLHAQGIEATQSSVSRDLRELGITKLDDGYGQIYAAMDSADHDIPVDLVRSIDTAGDHLTVIKTAIGAATRVALVLDRSDWSEIVGTVSGDDTIFVATASGRDQRKFVGRLANLRH